MQAGTIGSKGNSVKKKSSKKRPPHEVPQYVPTEEQIRAACAEIRAGWTDAMWLSRSTVSVKPVEVQSVSTSQLGCRAANTET